MKTALDHIFEFKKQKAEPVFLGHGPLGMEDYDDWWMNENGFPLKEPNYFRYLKDAVVFQVEEASWTPSDTKKAAEELTAWQDHWESKSDPGTSCVTGGSHNFQAVDFESSDRQKPPDPHHLNYPNCRLPYDNMVLIMKVSGALTEDLVSTTIGQEEDSLYYESVDSNAEAVTGGKDVAVWLFRRPSSEVEKDGWLAYSFYILGTGQDQTFDNFIAPVTLFGSEENGRTLTPAFEEVPCMALRLCSQIVCDFYLEKETHNLYFDEVYLKVMLEASPDGEKGIIGVSPVVKQVFIGLLSRALKVCAVINCKNVGTKDVHPSNKLQRSRRRKKRAPLVSYKTLVIKNTATKKSASNGQGAGTNRLHLCRGHFKTYTEDSPLMGRHVGTYWWQPMARGKSREGQVIKDYSVQKTQEKLA